MASKLNDICVYAKGKTAVAGLTGQTYISTENMLPNKGGITTAASLPTAEYAQAYKKGDVLVSNIRPYFKKIWHADYAGGCSNDVLVFRAVEGVDPTFLYYVLADDNFFIYATATSKGTKMPRGDKHAIMEYGVPDFDIEVQKKIGTLLRSIDQKIAVNSQINDNLEQQAAAMVGQYFDSISSTASLGDIMRFENGFAFQSSTYLPKGRYRIITIKNVQDGQLDAAGAACIDELPQRMKAGCILQIGDALLSLTGNVGRVGIVCENDLLLNQRVAKIVPHRKELLPLLYFIYRQSSMKTQLESIAKGTAQLNLSPVETLKLMVPYDKEAALALSNALTPIYQALIANNRQNIVLASMRDSLLPLLMRGEIDVSNIDI